MMKKEMCAAYLLCDAPAFMRSHTTMNSFNSILQVPQQSYGSPYAAHMDMISSGTPPPLSSMMPPRPADGSDQSTINSYALDSVDALKGFMDMIMGGAQYNRPWPANIPSMGPSAPWSSLPH